MPRPKPGLTFSLVCDVGFAVGIVTHDVPRVGSLIWIAEPTLDDQPSIEQVRQMTEWRWPVFFPLGAAIRRKSVTPIGMVPVPNELQMLPSLRSRDGRGGWTLVRFVGSATQAAGPTVDPAIPRYSVVNDTRLKEMIVSDWRPENDW